MNSPLETSWKRQLAEEIGKEYFSMLTHFLQNEYATSECYPPTPLIYAAFDQCPFSQLKVVILGQDPYHGPGQANGLCFSVNDGVPIPPSLVNIFKEIKQDIGLEIPPSGNLQRWATQGVLLLNATLTVRANSAGSHQNKGWETFTDAVIRKINEEKENVVFLLWGSYAQTKGAIINTQKHRVLKSPHPSPLSAYRGFFGNHHFSKTNEYLSAHGLAPIAW